MRAQPRNFGVRAKTRNYQEAAQRRSEGTAQLIERLDYICSLYPIGPANGCFSLAHLTPGARRSGHLFPARVESDLNRAIVEPNDNQVL